MRLHLCCCCDVKVAESDFVAADLPETLSEFGGCWMIGVGHRGGMVGEFDELDVCLRSIRQMTTSVWAELHAARRVPSLLKAMRTDIALPLLRLKKVGAIVSGVPSAA